MLVANRYARKILAVRLRAMAMTRLEVATLVNEPVDERNYDRIATAFDALAEKLATRLERGTK